MNDRTSDPTDPSDQTDQKCFLPAQVKLDIATHREQDYVMPEEYDRALYEYADPRVLTPAEENQKGIVAVCDRNGVDVETFCKILRTRKGVHLANVYTELHMHGMFQAWAQQLYRGIIDGNMKAMEMWAKATGRLVERVIELAPETDLENVEERIRGYLKEAGISVPDDQPVLEVEYSVGEQR